MQVPAVPSTNITATNPQASSPPSPNITAQTTLNSGFFPNPNQASLLPFSNSGFAQTFSPTLNSNFDANPQRSSLMALMSESLYNWPNQEQQGLGDEDLFDFSGLQNLSGMNNFNSDTNIYSSLDMNVRLVLLGLPIIIHIHSSPQLCLLHSGTATIPTATLPQISTCCLTSTRSL